MKVGRITDAHPLHHVEVVVSEEVVGWPLPNQELKENNSEAEHISFLGDFPSLHVLCRSNTSKSVPDMQEWSQSHS